MRCAANERNGQSFGYQDFAYISLLGGKQSQ
jgi:hypothetical protein